MIHMEATQKLHNLKRIGCRSTELVDPFGPRYRDWVSLMTSLAGGRRFRSSASSRRGARTLGRAQGSTWKRSTSKHWRIGWALRHPRGRRRPARRDCQIAHVQARTESPSGPSATLFLIVFRTSVGKNHLLSVRKFQEMAKAKKAIRALELDLDWTIIPLKWERWHLSETKLTGTRSQSKFKEISRTPSYRRDKNSRGHMSFKSHNRLSEWSPSRQHHLSANQSARQTCKPSNKADRVPKLITWSHSHR